MIFSLIILVLIAAVAFFHYTQGFFSAFISAVIAVLAAALAIGYNEVVVDTLLKGKFADYANALAICSIFTIVYLGLRLIMDKAIPGNVRLQPLVDKIGAAIMGLVAGIFSVGTLAVAAQTLPFGPTIGGFSRYATEDVGDVVIPNVIGSRPAVDATISDELVADNLQSDDATPASLWIPADDWVVGLVSTLSQGSLAGSRPFTDVHPDYLQELFGQRIGIQVGAKRVASNDKTKQVSVAGAYTTRDTAMIDGEIPGPRHGRKIPTSLTGTPLVIRVMFGEAREFGDGLVRFSLGSVRLVGKGKNYYPVAIAQDGKIFFQKSDDFLFVNVADSDRGADLVFQGVSEDLFQYEKNGNQIFASGTFIEVKRLARLDLTGVEITAEPTKTGVAQVLRKPLIAQAITQSAQAAVAVEAGFAVSKTETAGTLPIIFAVNTDEKDAQMSNERVSARLTDGKFSALRLNGDTTIAALAKGTNPVKELYVPKGYEMLQISGTPVEKSKNDPWLWTTQFNEFILVDSKGNKHIPCGAWTKVIRGSGETFLAQYVADPEQAKRLGNFQKMSGHPTEGTIVYLVPAGTIKDQLTFRGKTLVKY